MAFRSATQNTTAFAYPYDTPAFNTSGAALPPGGVAVDAASAYAFAPMLSVDGEARPQTALYLSVGHRLQEFWFLFRVGWSARNLSVPMEIDRGAPIAATSYVYGGKRYVQVLVTRTDGGVRMAYLDGGTNSTADWTYTDEVSGMEDVVPLSPIAATQTGRTSTTGMPVWERVGVVNTTVVD
ncbi:hypothetical protein GTA08_BOTSDO13731 [Botryosphaeria dothidea]|uniref:Uncharacterized protein n=1 Tax=Botryosphaeria dothidea TaxID=55169 RepID=A0A8H4N4F8_9PEZI|nr:hypothetical protein GTA08_BOTSDO13731 [Botryosphaeria dothidea]